MITWWTPSHNFTFHSLTIESGMFMLFSIQQILSIFAHFVWVFKYVDSLLSFFFALYEFKVLVCRFSLSVFNLDLKAQWLPVRKEFELHQGLHCFLENLYPQCSVLVGSRNIFVREAWDCHFINNSLWVICIYMYNTVPP